MGQSASRDKNGRFKTKTKKSAMQRAKARSNHPKKKVTRKGGATAASKKRVSPDYPPQGKVSASRGGAASAKGRVTKKSSTEGKPEYLSNVARDILSTLGEVDSTASLLANSFGVSPGEEYETGGQWPSNLKYDLEGSQGHACSTAGHLGEVLVSISGNDENFSNPSPTQSGAPISELVDDLESTVTLIEERMARLSETLFGSLSEDKKTMNKPIALVENLKSIQKRVHGVYSDLLYILKGLGYEQV